MEWERYYEQRRRHHEWRQKKKAVERNAASRHPNKTTMMYGKKTVSSRPASNHWSYRVTCLDLVNQLDPTPTPNLRSKNSAVLPDPIETPKTPPPSAAIRRRQSAIAEGYQEPISPPNPLRLASTTQARNLPNPITTPWIRSSPPPLAFENVGHPFLRAYKIRLPWYLIDGPLVALDTLVEAAEAHVNGLPNGWETDLYSLTKCDIACKDIPGISSQVGEISRYISSTIQLLYGCRKISLDKNQPHLLKYSAEAGHTGGKTACALAAFEVLFHICSTTRRNSSHTSKHDIFLNRHVLFRSISSLFSICRIGTHQLAVSPIQTKTYQMTVKLHCDRCDITANLSLSKRDSFSGGGTYIAATGQVVKLEKGEFLLHPGHLLHAGNPITTGTRYLLVMFANIK